MEYKNTTEIAVVGLKALAEESGRPISEQAVITAAEIVQEGHIISRSDVLNAALALNPGDLYTRGLEVMARTVESLRETTKNTIEEMEVQGSGEHIELTKKAFRFLTGKEF